MAKNQVGYLPDLSMISLSEFKDGLKTGRLLPSRKPLLDDIDKNFAKLQKAWIDNAEDLRESLKRNSRLKSLAKEIDISGDYLKLLRREVNNLLPTPVKFSDIPNISEEVVSKLNSLNIVNAEMLFVHVRDADSRKKFGKISGLSNEEVLWLTKLVDVSRIKWVGPKLARLLVDTRYDTVEKLAKAKPSDILDALNDAKNAHKAYQGALGINDIDSWISQVVSNTPLIIEYQ